MTQLLAGLVGGIGLFIVGMWLLTENLKAVASRRLRRKVAGWTGHRLGALLWGSIAGATTQSMSALSFIVVSILRSGLITTKGALALVLGGNIGVSALVVIVTFEIKTLALYVLGFSGACMVSERLARYRPIAASCLGGAMIIIGLMLLKEAAAPLAVEPWFRTLLEGTAGSPALAFAAAAVLTALVQSSSAVSVFGISLAAVGVLSVEQAMMVMYGSCIGSGATIYMLSTGLSGQSRQVPMYMVVYNLLICALVVPMLYCEMYLGVPLVKAWATSFDIALDQQLALVYVAMSCFPIPFLISGLTRSSRVLERLWPASPADALARPMFIHDHASVDVETSIVLIDLEQRRAVGDLTEYFAAVRERAPVEPLRDATRKLLGEIDEFLNDLHSAHPMYGVEERNTLHSRQKLLVWFEDALGALCEGLGEIGDGSRLSLFRSNMCESVDAVLLALIDAMKNDDALSWDLARQLTGERDAMMRELREQFFSLAPPLKPVEMLNVLLITNSVEEIFFLLSKIEREWNPAPEPDEHVPRG